MKQKKSKKSKKQRITVKEKVLSFLLMSEKYQDEHTISYAKKIKISSIKKALKELSKEDKVAYVNSGKRHYITEKKYRYVKYWGVI
jgi:hypothetical protein